MTNSKIITIDPVVETGVYAAGDLMGEMLTLTDAAAVAGGTGIIQSVTVIDQDSEQAPIDILFWDQEPTATTFTDNAALDVADADLDNAIGSVSVLAADYIALNDNSIATIRGLSLVFAAVGSRTIYAAMIARGTPTYTATGDIRLRFGILQDV